MEFYKEPVKVLKTYTQHIDDIKNEGQAVREHSVELKAAMMRKFNDPAKLLDAELHLDTVYKRIQAFNMSSNVNRGMYNPRILAMYRDVGTAVNGVSKETNMEKIIEGVYKIIQKQKNNMRKLNKVLEEKVSKQLASKFNLKSSQASAEDAAYVKALSDYVEEAKKLSHEAGVSTKKLANVPTKANNKIDELKEVYDGAKLLNTMVNSSEPGFFGGIVTGALSAAGASGAGAMGMNWFVGAMLGQQAGRQIGGFFNNPVKSIQLIESIAGKSTAALDRVKQAASAAGTAAEGARKKVRNLPGYSAKYLGYGENQEKDYAKLRNVLRAKLDTIDPVVIQESEEFKAFQESAPQHAQAILTKQMLIANYLKQNMPREPKKYADHREDMEKLDALIEAAFDPEEVIRKFAITGRADALKHVQELYPSLVDDFKRDIYTRLYDKELNSHESKLMSTLFPNHKGLQEEADSFAEVYNIAQDNTIKPMDAPPAPKIKKEFKSLTDDGRTLSDRLSER